MIEDATQAPLSVAPGIGKHVGKDLIHAWHPVALALRMMMLSSAHKRSAFFREISNVRMIHYLTVKNSSKFHTVVLRLVGLKVHCDVLSSMMIKRSVSDSHQ